MIIEHDLREAIAECQGERSPNANTCIKLAAYYTILDHIREDQSVNLPEYSQASFHGVPTLLDSNTEFAEVVNSLDQHTIMGVMDELMTTLSVVNPRLYSSVMLKLRS